MKTYLVTWTVEVNIPADSKADAERAARDLVYCNPEEFDLVDYVSTDPLSIQEIDEHGDPIL